MLFDFLLGDLEGALEKLVVIQESDWRAYVDDTEPMMGESREKLGERFFKYKTEMNRLKGILENQFSRIISDIEDDFPSV